MLWAKSGSTRQWEHPPVGALTSGSTHQWDLLKSVSPGFRPRMRALLVIPVVMVILITIFTVFLYISECPGEEREGGFSPAEPASD